ncbi:UNVERIFIED_CONTAM: hypothetical protein Slati_2184900 [Sesamum latifolium]|uniref:Zinc knuckle CX2CX4HX4C domain-containing protein n=1 Tax=Sesamum latifolium TaxID=2727402 RepID=A0AAW2WSC2_9LAMI
MRTEEVVRVIGGHVGQWEEDTTALKDFSSTESVRIQISLDVNRPLRRVLKLKSDEGDELLIRFTYERLPNFCYICRKLGHISRFCDRYFEEGFVDPGETTPYGPWIRKNLSMRSSFNMPGGTVRTPTVNPVFLPISRSARGDGSPVQRGQQVFGDFRQLHRGEQLSRDDVGGLSPTLSVHVKGRENVVYHAGGSGSHGPRDKADSLVRPSSIIADPAMSGPDSTVAQVDSPLSLILPAHKSLTTAQSIVLTSANIPPTQKADHFIAQSSFSPVLQIPSSPVSLSGASSSKQSKYSSKTTEVVLHQVIRGPITKRKLPRSLTGSVDARPEKKGGQVVDVEEENLMLAEVAV